MITPRICGSAALGTLLLALPGDAPQFAPAVGTQLSKRFTTHLTFVLEDADASLEGETPPLPDLHMNGEWTLEIAVDDEYRSVRDGRPLDMQRTYSEIAFAIEYEQVINLAGLENSVEGTASSKLEGDVVRFLWDADEEDWKRSFIGDHAAAEDALETLREDMDLHGFLPQEEVEVGDS